MTPSQRDLAIRCSLALAPAAGVVWLARISADTPLALMGVVPCIGMAALIITPSLTSVAGEGIGSLFFCPREWGEPRAPLSKVDGLLLAEDWETAERLLFDLSRGFPSDIEVWTRVFRLAWAVFHDPERARKAHRRALRSITDPKLVLRLNHLYLIHAQAHLRMNEAWELEQAAVERRTQLRSFHRLNRAGH